MTNFLTLIWVAFLILQLSGAKTHVPAILAIGCSLLAFLWSLRHSSIEEIARAADKALQRRISKMTIAAYVVMTIGASITALWLDYLSFNGTMWDLTMYIQETFHMATKGLPEATFPGTLVSHHHTHRSLSLYALGFLFRLTDSPFVVLFWQGFFLFAPALVAMLWLKMVSKKLTSPLPVYAYFFAFLSYAASPAILRQQTWPYVFYMGGFSLIALSYLFLYEKKWLPWFFTAALLAFEKEDFGVVSAGFGLLVVVETLVASFSKNPKSGRLLHRVYPGLLGLSLIIVGISSFLLFHHNHAGVVTFESRFGTLGATPLEALKTIVLKPWVPLQLLFKPDAIAYWFFFLSSSFVWIMPRWSALRFLVPVLPILGANLIAAYAAMRSLKDPYGIPIATGVSATIVLGVFASSLQRRSREVAILTLIAASVFPLLWDSQTPFRTVKELLPAWQETSLDRQFLATLQKDRNQVICCEERSCAYFADRPLILQDRACTMGTALLTGVREVIFLRFVGSEDKPKLFESSPNHQTLPHTPYPLRWRAAGNTIEVSEPVAVIAK